MEEKRKEPSQHRKTRILIADDHWVVVEGISAALQKHDEFEVVGTASDGLEAIKRVRSLKPDIVIMDISMPNLNGVEAACEIMKFNQEVRIVIFTMYMDKEYVLSLFRAGISGYVLKEETISDLILALKTMIWGGTYYSKSVQKIIQGHVEDLEKQGEVTAREVGNGLVHLSAREKEVFPLLADGLSAREISERLGISPKTVESHKYNIMEKLKVTSVTELTKIALRKNLIKL
jgi:RNA polymerase sigma factor (sigma-70 family)